jgi:hypothetical protein
VTDAVRQLEAQKRILELAKQHVRALDEGISVVERDVRSAERLLEISRQEADATGAQIRDQTLQL